MGSSVVVVVHGRSLENTDPHNRTRQGQSASGGGCTRERGEGARGQSERPEREGVIERRCTLLRAWV